MLTKCKSCSTRSQHAFHSPCNFEALHSQQVSSLQVHYSLLPDAFPSPLQVYHSLVTKCISLSLQAPHSLFTTHVSHLTHCVLPISIPVMVPYFFNIMWKIELEAGGTATREIKLTPPPMLQQANWLATLEKILTKPQGSLWIALTQWSVFYHVLTHKIWMIKNKIKRKHKSTNHFAMKCFYRVMTHMILIT